MKKQLHPLVATVVIVLALGAIWFFYTKVFTGQTVGQVGTPASVGAAMSAAPHSATPPGAPKGWAPGAPKKSGAPAGPTKHEAAGDAGHAKPPE